MILIKVIILITHHPTKVITLILEINYQIEIIMQVIHDKMKVVPATGEGYSSVTQL